MKRRVVRGVFRTQSNIYGGAFLRKFSIVDTGLGSTVKPVHSGHLRFLKKVSAITRRPLYYRLLDFLGKKGNRN